MATPVIDIFAGPGGLGEGFCSLLNVLRQRQFKIALSIEKEPCAHETLTLRSFFRQFQPNNLPQEYYDFVKGKLSLNELYRKFPDQSKAAKDESWLAELGKGKTAVSINEVDTRIQNALNGETDWLLIGGPPCQAYSVVGRSRRKEKILDEKKDERVGLYKQYLRILAVHNPAVFVMENVKGLLSAETKDSPIFSRILEDLSDPVTAYKADFGQNGIQLVCPGYKIYSLKVKAEKFDETGNPIFRQKDFVIHAEKFGIPQTRHRVILLGVRRDIDFLPHVLQLMDEISINQVLTGLPRLRSGISKDKDGSDEWKKTIFKIIQGRHLTATDKEVKEYIIKQLEKITIPHCGKGANYIQSDKVNIQYRSDWFLDDRLNGVCNHESRSHMPSDLHRYFFVSCFGKVKGYSPTLGDFPDALLPSHENVNEGIEDKKFADRFRVQTINKASKTITSHISKDGHYYIHYDPTQCRSLTVREAARLQTFPDNYFFCGPRTAQFTQVGNAVPPLLANKIAEIVLPIFQFLRQNKQLEQVNQEILNTVLV